jgi:hypothetical protein
MVRLEKMEKVLGVEFCSKNPPKNDQKYDQST